MLTFDRLKFGDILRRLRTERGVKQIKIAERLKVSKQLVSHWEAGRSEMTLPSLLAVCDLLQITPNDLLLDRADEPSAPSAQSAAVSVPILSRNELLSPEEKRWASVLPELNYNCWHPCSAASVAFQIFDRSLQPQFQIGDLVVVDPERMPEPGDCIAVALRSERTVLFRRYRPPGEGAHVVAPFTLVSDDPNFEPRFIKRGHDPYFIGTLVEHVISASQR